MIDHVDAVAAAAPVRCEGARMQMVWGVHRFSCKLLCNGTPAFSVV